MSHSYQTKPLRQRSDVVAYVWEHALTTACERAIDDDRVLVCGLFKDPCEEAPYIGVMVTSAYGKRWWMRVYINETHYHLNHGPPAKWEHWIGDQHPDSEVFGGDNHPQFKAYKELANEACC